MVPIKVAVVEDHNSALPHIHHAVKDKRLPFEHVLLVHFDAHPDLLAPASLPAEAVYDRHKLYDWLESSAAGIAEWILPAVYTGIVDCIAWVRPRWAQQLPDGWHTVKVGRDTVSQRMRVDCSLPYYLEELLYVPSEQLAESRECRLFVTSAPLDEITVSAHDTCAAGAGASAGAGAGAGTRDGGASARGAAVAAPDQSAHEEGLVVRPAQPYVLDICLDYFAAVNPFREDCVAVVGEEGFAVACLVSTRLWFKEPGCKLPRDTQWQHAQAFDRLVAEFFGDPGMAVAGDVDFGEWVLQCDSLYREPSFGSAAFTKLRQTLGKCSRDDHSKVLAAVRGASSCPHHPAYSSTALLPALLDLQQFVRSLQAHPPQLVTIARSAVDGYTPANVVDELQYAVVRLVTSRFDAHVDYDDDVVPVSAAHSRLWDALQREHGRGAGVTSRSKRARLGDPVTLSDARPSVSKRHRVACHSSATTALPQPSSPKPPA